jgi:bacterioferritin-associated ferredoxin
MYVCVCRAVTDGQIRECVGEGPCSMRELRLRLGVASQCGRCAHHAKELIRDAGAPVAGACSPAVAALG